VYGLIEEGRSHEYVIITGASDRRAAAVALSQASGRFERVDDHGRELSDEEAEREEEMVLSGEVEEFSYTPNWVSGVRMAPRGPWCYVDCKGYIPPPMRERMIAVLVEELERAAVSARVEVPSPGNRGEGDQVRYGPLGWDA
jgi:hypothetical protein